VEMAVEDDPIQLVVRQQVVLQQSLHLLHLQFLKQALVVAVPSA
jgi:hypothetical protein